MASPLKQICDKLGVCTEEALFYLEGFRWDLDVAMEACRSKTLPSLTAQPPSPDQPPSPAQPTSSAQPTSTENERVAAEKLGRKKKIESFLEVAHGSSEEDAERYLSHYNWSIEHAAANFCAHRYDQPETRLSHDGFSGSDLVQDVLSKVPQFRNTPTNVRIGTPPSASTPPFELKQESIKEFRETLPEASSQAVIDCLNHCNGNVKNAISYFKDGYSEKPRSGIATAQVVKNFSGIQDSSKESPPLVASSQVEESSSHTQTRELLNSLKHDELIDFFVDMAGGGVTREVATFFLRENNWIVDQALSCLFEAQETTLLQTLQEGGETGSSSRDPPLPSMGLPSQSQFESSYVSSGPTETQGSPEEGSEGDVTVAVPGMASSQVDGKAAEGGSSTETVPDPFANRDSTTVETQTAPSTITITIRLAVPGTELELPFRSDQTVRDIHNAIDQRYPDNVRGYVLRSMDGVDYKDWNITVDRVSIRGTLLFQMYP